MKRTGIFRIAVRTVCVLAPAWFAWLTAGAYPLDGAAQSGIRRLAGYGEAQQRAGAPKLPPGALLGVDAISLRLADMPADAPDFDAAPADPALSEALTRLLARRDRSYGIVVVDWTDPDNIRWGAVRPDVQQNPGSVGKIVTMAALFDALARAFPDTGERARVLRETRVPAGEWIIADDHVVPHFQPDSGRNRFRPLEVRDEFTLSEWVDHMISPSANAAGSVVWREAMLVEHFGARYPVSADEARAFFDASPPAELAELALRISVRPLADANIDTARLQQGSFWTRVGKRRVPGTISFATPRELARFVFRLEQGRLVDAWSSLEMKRYLYMTKRRYRYVYAPELADLAVYFKSGSLYQCRPEEGYRCGKYLGNARNMMNSVAIVETLPATETPRRYGVALMSNVLKVNSAWDHSRIAAAIDELVATGRAEAIRDTGSDQDIAGSGQS